MKNGIYTCVILMAFLALSESVYAAIPVLTVASDTIRRVVIYFDKEETDIDFSYKTNNHEINVLDSLLEEKINQDISLRSMWSLLYRLTEIRFTMPHYLSEETIR